MRKRWKFVVILFLCLLLLSGCRERKVKATPVVTGVYITCRHGDEVFTRTYTQPGKVRRILYYLRQQQTKGYAETDPERVMGDAFWIQLQLSDGQCRTYRQRSGKFLSRDCHRWKNIDESYGRRLYYLLHAIPEDPNSVAKGSAY